jgi:hypothetical protein
MKDQARRGGGPAAVSAWASAARDVLALLFTPVSTIISVALIGVLAGWWGGWTPETQRARISWLGALAVIYAVGVFLGGNWFQRNRLESLKFSGPGGISGEINNDADEGPAPVTTTVETRVEP